MWLEYVRSLLILAILFIRRDSEKPEDEPYIYISRYSGNGKLCSDYLDYLDWEDLFYDT